VTHIDRLARAAAMLCPPGALTAPSVVYLALALMACGAGERPDAGSPPTAGRPGGLVAPTVPEGSANLPFLRPPFEGSFPIDNPFDHTPSVRAPGEGEVLAFDGQPRLGTHNHRGLDWPLPVGTEVLAPAEGVVRLAGVQPPFACGPLGRVVADQVAVVLTHTRPDGSVWETALHHLSDVTVQPGAHVAAGAVVGHAGATGCATGPHLHLDVFAVEGDVRRPIDPFGWAGRGDDPWGGAEGGRPSVWLWSRAPDWFRERVLPAPEGLAVHVARVRTEGWRDEAFPGQELVELAVQPGSSPAGWELDVLGGGRLILPDGLRSSEDGRVRIAGAGLADLRFPDAGGVLRLMDPSGQVVQEVAWGLGARRRRVGGVLGACPRPDLGCIPLPASGAVVDVAWSPSGGRLAARVGLDRDATLWLVDPVVGTMQLVSFDAFEAAHSPSHPAWISDDVLLADAIAPDGPRVAAVVAGLAAGQAFAPASVPGTLKLRGVVPGAAVVLRANGGVEDLAAWRLGDGDLTPLTADRRSESGGALSEPGGEVLFARSGEIYAVATDGDALPALRTVRTGVPEGIVPWAFGSWVVWVEGDALVVSGADGVRTRIAPITAASFSPGFGVWLAGADGRVTLWTPSGARAVDAVARPGTVALAGVRVGEGWRLARAAPLIAGGEAALFVDEATPR
jgi:murein DD-endopeptidase MepM/ murein hydrolase activator NlpD